MASAGELTRFWLTTALALVVMVVELRRRTLPNWLTLGPLLPVLGAAYAFDRTGDAVLGGLAAFASGLLVWRKGYLGGGVAKAGLLVGAAGGLVVGASLAAAFGGLVVIATGLERSTHPRLRRLADTQVRGGPLVLVVALVGLVLRHVLAERGWPT